MTQKTYHGFCSLQEQWADNRQLYQNTLDGKVAGLDRREAKRELEFWERFPPEVPHDRVVAQVIGVYLIQNPAWVRAKPGARIALPHGEEEKVLEIDLGGELVRLAGGSPYVEEVIERNVVRGLLDGTFIRGDIFKQILPKESALKGLEQYVSLAMEKEGHYSFSPRVEIQSPSKVVVYDITKYLSIDGERIKEDRERVLPGFAIEKDASCPTRFRLWVTKKMNLNQGNN